jgi:hypothetical protein
MATTMVVTMVVAMMVVRAGIAAVSMRVAHYPRMTEEPCCSTSTKTPRPHLQRGRARSDRTNPRQRHPLRNAGSSSVSGQTERTYARPGEPP